MGRERILKVGAYQEVRSKRAGILERDENDPRKACAGSLWEAGPEP